MWSLFAFFRRFFAKKPFNFPLSFSSVYLHKKGCHQYHFINLLSVVDYLPLLKNNFLHCRSFHEKRILAQFHLQTQGSAYEKIRRKLDIFTFSFSSFFNSFNFSLTFMSLLLSNISCFALQNVWSNYIVIFNSILTSAKLLSIPLYALHFSLFSHFLLAF